MADFETRAKALGKLGRTKRGKQIIRDHGAAIASILGAQALLEKRQCCEAPSASILGSCHNCGADT